MRYVSYGEKWKVEVIAVAVVSLTVEMLVPYMCMRWETVE